jgi:hypothetical protein
MDFGRKTVRGNRVWKTKKIGIGKGGKGYKVCILGGNMASM